MNMIIENPKLSIERVERICSRKKLSKHLLVQKTGEEVLKYSDNCSNSWNGGDYKDWLQYIQYWCAERSSCDMESGREMQAGGFLFKTPVIITFRHYSNNMSVFFADKSKIYISPSEWDQIDQWESMCSSDWGLDFNYKAN